MACCARWCRNSERGSRNITNWPRQKHAWPQRTLQARHGPHRHFYCDYCGCKWKHRVSLYVAHEQWGSGYFGDLFWNRLFTKDNQATLPFLLPWVRAWVIKEASPSLKMSSLRFSILWCRSILHVMPEFAAGGLNLKDYLKKEAWLTVDQILDQPHTFRDVYAAYCSSLGSHLEVISISSTTPGEWWRYGPASSWNRRERSWVRGLKTLLVLEYSTMNSRKSSSMEIITVKLFNAVQWRWTAVDSRRHSCLAPVPQWQSRHHDSGSHQAKQGGKYDDCSLGRDTSYIDLVTSMASYVHSFGANYFVSY